MKILIAEDDQYIREGLHDLLEAEGYQTGLAVDGAEAVTKYHEETPHLVLLDIMMPGKDGYTVCREIRGHSSQVPVIFLSAKSEEIDRVIEVFPEIVANLRRLSPYWDSKAQGPTPEAEKMLHE